MLESLTVYLVLFCALFFFSKEAADKKTFWYACIGILFYTVVFAFRNNVGMDYSGYLQIYNDALRGELPEKDEPGWLLLLMSMARAHMPVTLFFGFFAFTQLFLVYWSLKDDKDVYPFLAVTFMLECVWLTYANGLRQQLAFTLFACAIPAIRDQSWLKYYLLVALAASMHYSALLLVIFYPLFRIKKGGYFNSIWLEYALFAAALVVSRSAITANLGDEGGPILEMLGYSHYLEQNSEKIYSVLTHRGVGYWVSIATAAYLIWLSNDVKNGLDRPEVRIIYDLMFFGLLWKYVFIESHIFSRINYYFIGFEYIFTAFTLMYLWRSKRSIAFTVLVALDLLTFAGFMSNAADNTALFTFIWQ